MSLGSWLQLASWDVGSFFGSSDDASHAAAYRAVQSGGSLDLSQSMSLLVNPSASDMAQEAAESASILTTVDSEQIKQTGFLADLDDALTTFWKNLLNVIKIFPWIAIGVGAVLVFFLVFYYLPKKRGSAA